MSSELACNSWLRIELDNTMRRRSQIVRSIATERIPPYLAPRAALSLELIVELKEDSRQR